MPLYPYRRHLSNCEFRDKGQNYTLCACPIWCDGLLDGKRYRRSLQTDDMARAQRRIDILQGGGRDGFILEGPTRTASAAIRSYLQDCEERNVRETTISSYRRTLSTLEKFLGAAPVSALEGERLKEYYSGRDVAPGTRVKVLKHLRALCAYCVEQGWIQVNPAKKIKPPRTEEMPTLPFTRAEVAKLLAACDRLETYPPANLRFIRRRAQALVLTLAYSGLRIGDVARLKRVSLEPSGHILLRTTKKNVPVKVLLHPDARAALESLPAPGGNPDYFFWSGLGSAERCADILRQTIGRLGKLAGIHAHPHRFRDTFAVELLTGGADLRTVQQLLGHKSIKTTERHYAHFVAEHQALLDRATSALDFSAKASRPLLVDPLKDRRRNAK